ncbi:MAG: haloacid dehalogenase [Verrucomicrobia bacterium A1]|nr:MAG: haloacid dehalogenase [Verrucomicrobia bacterium A1]
MSSTSGFVGAVEMRPSFARRRVRHVVFDFDGTLSWLRHGWPDIMLNLFLDRFPRQSGETEESVRNALLGIVLGLNGHPTIRQMTRFGELVYERGGAPQDPADLLHVYTDRLEAEIAARTALIRSGHAQPDDFVVHGAHPLLERLRHLGIPCSILSSTLEERVRGEAELLGLAPFFDGRIHGGTGDPGRFSKMEVFRRILRETKIDGTELLSFGDGPVEIADTKSLGGAAIAVCSDETRNGSGVMDPCKRRQLLDAGADAAIPDYRDAPALLDRMREP